MILSNPFQRDHVNRVKVPEHNWNRDFILSPALLQFFRRSNRVQSDRFRQCNPVNAESDAHQEECSAKADRRHSGVKVVARDVALKCKNPWKKRFLTLGGFESVEIIIRCIVVTFVWTAAWRAFYGRK